MELFEREFFLSKILCGYTKFVSPKGNFKILSPSLDIIYESNEIYMDFYKQSVDLEIMQDADVLNMLIEKEMWDLEKEELLKEKIPKDIENFQEQMYLSCHKKTELGKLRKYLNKANEYYSELSSIRNQFFNYTCHGVANFARFNYIIENTVYDYNGVKYDWKDFSVSSIVNYANSVVIDPRIIREISRSLPWVNQWSAAKANGQIFPVSGIELTVPQQLLLMWSRMYDSISESPDCPELFVIEDDDLLDGWLINQRKKRKEESAKKAVENMSRNSKINNAEEIFILAESYEEAKEISGINSIHSKQIINQRMSKVLSDGEVAVKDFDDIKKKKQMQLTEMYSKAMKGK